VAVSQELSRAAIRGEETPETPLAVKEHELDFVLAPTGFGGSEAEPRRSSSAVSEGLPRGH
jgi:hypothetical protein